MPTAEPPPPPHRRPVSGGKGGGAPTAGQTRKRAGARSGALDPMVRAALRAEAARLAEAGGDAAVVAAVGDFFAAVDAELARVARVRLDALTRLRRAGMSYDQIASATGLSKSRVAQLVREGRSLRRAER